MSMSHENQTWGLTENQLWACLMNFKLDSLKFLSWCLLLRLSLFQSYNSMLWSTPAVGRCTSIVVEAPMSTASQSLYLYGNFIGETLINTCHASSGQPVWNSAGLLKIYDRFQEHYTENCIGVYGKMWLPNIKALPTCSLFWVICIPIINNYIDWIETSYVS